MIDKAVLDAADELADAVRDYGAGKIEMHELAQCWAFYMAARGREDD